VASEKEEPDEIVYENGSARTVERNPEGDSTDYPYWVQKLGHRFRLLRREVVSRSGERTHNRVIYRSEEHSPESSTKE